MSSTRQHNCIRILAAVVVALAASCRKIEEKNVLGENTKLPEQNPDLTGVVVRSDTLSFIYKSGASKPSFKQGDIVVGQTGGGYLKKVASTSVQGDTLIVLTQQAALTDAIERCDVETTFALSASSMVTKASVAETAFSGSDGKNYRMRVKHAGCIVQPSSAGAEFTLKFPDLRICICHNGDTVAYVTCDTAIMKKSISLDFGLKIDVFTIKEFRTIATSADGLEFKGAKFSMCRTIAGGEWELKLQTVPLSGVVVMVGPLPIAISFELGVYAGLAADLTLSLQCDVVNHVSLTATNKVGAEFASGTWSPVWQNTVDGDATFAFRPSVSLSAEVEGSVRASLDAKLYGVLGPSLFVKAYQYNVASYPPFDYSLGVGLAAGLGFKVEVLSWSLVDYTKDFIDVKKELVHSTNGGVAFDTLANDDGTPSWMLNDQDYYAACFSPTQPSLLEEAMFAFYVPQDSAFVPQACSLFVYDKGGGSAPGARLATGVFQMPNIQPGYWGWVIADLSPDSLSLSTDFWIGYKRNVVRPPFGLSDATPSQPNRNMYRSSPQGPWSSWTNGDFMVRAVVSHSNRSARGAILAREQSCSVSAIPVRLELVSHPLISDGTQQSGRGFMNSLSGAAK